MRVYLARHGEAAQGENDSERPLTSRGRKELELLAHFLLPCKLQVDYFFHSDKLRAKQTAELLSKAIYCARGVEERSGLAPSDLVGPIASEIKQFGSDLALVGHMPFMGKLLSKLISGYEDRDVLLFQTATLVCLEKIEADGWIIRWALCPDFFSRSF